MRPAGSVIVGQPLKSKGAMKRMRQAGKVGIMWNSRVTGKGGVAMAGLISTSTSAVAWRNCSTNSSRR